MNGHVDDAFDYAIYPTRGNGAMGTLTALAMTVLFVLLLAACA